MRGDLIWLVGAGLLLLTGFVWWAWRASDACWFAVAPPDQETYYVAPDGHGCACTLACPCAVRTAMRRVQRSGETILFARGTYETTSHDDRVRYEKCP